MPYFTEALLIGSTLVRESRMTELEQVVGALQELAKSRPLKGEAKSRARQLMSQLKKWGYTNQEIVELTGKSWSEQSIKQEYTRGASVEDASVKQRALEILSELAARGLTLDDVEETVAMSSDLADRKVTYDQVGSLLQEVERSNTSVAELIRLNSDTKRSGMSIANLAEVRTYKAKLDAAGLTEERLLQINKAVETFRNPDDTLKAIGAYKTVVAIDAHIRELTSNEKQHESSIAELTAKGAKLRAEQERVRARLELVDRLASEGFDEPTLKGLAASSAKLGGVAGVITAINAYADLTEIRAETKKMKKEQSEAETALKQARANWSHEFSVIRMAEALLYDLKFSPEAITRMYKIAKIYGEPVEVLNALGRYSSMKELQAKIDELESKRSAIIARIEELEAELQKVRGVMEELQGATDEVLKPIATAVKKGIKDIKAEFREGAENLGALKEKAEQLGEVVQLAEVILAVDKYPSEAKDIPMDYVILLARGITKLCRAKKLNPKIAVGENMASKYMVSWIKEFDLIDLVEWVERGASKLAEG